MTGRICLSILALALSVSAQAKTFQNSYVSFDVPDNWTCLQEGFAWTCTPQNPVEAKEAVIVMAAKVAGPEDNLFNFMNYLKQPKKLTTKVGTPMPSMVMRTEERMLGGQKWVAAQHFGSEIRDYYTLYLATVKDKLAILVSFSVEKNKYTTYNPIFDQSIKTLRITASNQLLFAKNAPGASSDVIGIQVPNGPVQAEELLPPPPRAGAKAKAIFILLILALTGAALAYIFTTRRKKISHGKSAKPRPK